MHYFAHFVQCTIFTSKQKRQNKDIGFFKLHFILEQLCDILVSQNETILFSARVHTSTFHTVFLY